MKIGLTTENTEVTEGEDSGQVSGNAPIGG